MWKAKFIITIEKDEVIDDITYYVLQIKQVKDKITEETWEVKERYSIMRELHKEIKASLENEANIPANIPEFPKKKWFGNKEEMFV
jgi:hypothetical protein